MFAIEPALVRDAVVAARPPRGASAVQSDEQVARVFAAAAWSGIVEPGDGVAGLLVQVLGPDAALRLLVENASADDIAARLVEAGVDGLGRAQLAAGLERWRPRLVAADALGHLRAAGHLGARLVVPDDDEWPSAFADLGAHAPLALWARGDTSRLAHPLSISMVGARTATGYGEQVCAEAAAGLVDRGFAIVSGGAYGIDGMAHRAALASDGVTIAFLAGGVDRLYPSGHESMLRRIAETGPLVSEVPPGTAPTRWRFLQRNRLIAALGRATVVVEAGRRSGSLNTAGHAAALGRPLGAVPGPVTSATSAGCHRLLREFDAVCVTDAEEMAELVLGPEPAERPDDPLRDERRRVLDALDSRSRSASDIARRSGLAPRAVETLLGLLELEGAIRGSASGWRRP